MSQSNHSHGGGDGIGEGDSGLSQQILLRAGPLRMDKVEKFQIVFNNPTATYFAGETVYGYGWVVVKEALYVQSICLEAIGEAKVEWMTSSDIQASDEEVFNHTTGPVGSVLGKTPLRPFHLCPSAAIRVGCSQLGV